MLKSISGELHARAPRSKKPVHSRISPIKLSHEDDGRRHERWLSEGIRRSAVLSDSLFSIDSSIDGSCGTGVTIHSIRSP